MRIPWFIKYMPRSFTELTFSTDVHFKVLNWLKNNKYGGVLHIIGTSGIGKTSLVKASVKVFKYNLIEITDVNVNNFKEIIKTKNSIINNNRNAVLIDESIIGFVDNFLASIENTKVPLIITSSGLYLKKIETLRIELPKLQNVNFLVKKILTNEKTYINDKIIYKLAEWCKYDLRMIINYLQLIHKVPEFVTLSNRLEKSIGNNIFQKCKLLLSRRMRFEDLEKLYESKVIKFLYNSIISRHNNIDEISNIILKISEINAISPIYQFLELEGFNRLRCEYVYTKDECADFSNIVFSEKTYLKKFFLTKYLKKINNRKNALHLRKILDFYKFSDILDEYEKKLQFNETNALLKDPLFRYKYNIGSSKAVKIDVSLENFYNL